MHSLLNWVLVAASAFHVSGSPEKSAVVAAVIEHRRMLIDQVTLFERCAAGAAAGRAPAALDSNFSPNAVAGLSPWTGDCPNRLMIEGSPQGARINSVSISDSAAQVTVQVYRGEWSHHETYNLRRLRHGWGVQEVLLAGWLQVDPVIPSSGPSTGPAKQRGQ
jgi:hypothetical protein